MKSLNSRMMGNQKLVEKFVRKFLDDPTYEQIKEAVERWIMMKFFEQLIR